MNLSLSLSLSLSLKLGQGDITYIIGIYKKAT